MGKPKRRPLADDEQHVLEHAQVRLLTSPADVARCDQLIVEHHYLHDATLVGEHLRYAITYQSRWLGVATWSGAAFHIKDRDAFIGWDFEQCRRRRPLLERILLSWQQRLTGPVQDNLVIVDGKKMRHGGVEMVNAVNGKGQYLGGLLTADKSNEIPAARQLLSRLDLGGKIVLADALHTQVETGQLILYEKGADYLMTVKGNQPTLQTTLQDLFDQQVFPPTGPVAEAGAPTGAQSRPAGNPRDPVSGGDPGPGRLSRRQTGGPLGDARETGGPMDAPGGVPDQQPDLGTTGGGRMASTQTQLLGD